MESGADQSFVLSTISEDAFWSGAIQIVQQELEEVGFHVQVQQYELSTYLEELAAGKVEAGALNGYLAIPTPLENFAYYNATEGIYTGAPTAQTTKLTEGAVSEPEIRRREQLWYEAQRVVSEGKYLLPVVYNPYVWALERGVSGFAVGSTGTPWFGEVGFAS